MSIGKYYIPIENLFTEDKYHDKADPRVTALSSLYEIKNYIPKTDHLITRKGIEELNWGVTGVTIPTPISRWRFENNLLDSVGGNHFTAYHTAGVNPRSTRNVEGDYALDLERDYIQWGQYPYCYIQHANLASAIPGTGNDFTITGWFLIEGKNGSVENSMGILAKGTHYSQAGFNLDVHSNRMLRLYIWGTGTCSDHTNSIYVATGIWYHVGVTYRNSDRRVTFRIWNNTEKAITANITDTASRTLESNTRPLELGRFKEGNTYVWDGRLDDIRIFSSVLTDEQIDAVRQDI